MASEKARGLQLVVEADVGEAGRELHALRGAERVGDDPLQVPVGLSLKQLLLDEGGRRSKPVHPAKTAGQ